MLRSLRFSFRRSILFRFRALRPVFRRFSFITFILFHLLCYFFLELDLDLGLDLGLDLEPSGRFYLDLEEVVYLDLVLED